ncbi:hypothetical protein [Komagataeibacter diospyri]|uniref:hypothetical protein n=1 Tax=Komagataeibacter diospyri TaxID=1932662 RepID=UPI00114119E3|nr:hypothetical protein [Komagataeibacter diospyri]
MMDRTLHGSDSKGPFEKSSHDITLKLKEIFGEAFSRSLSERRLSGTEAAPKKNFIVFVQGLLGIILN